MSTTAQAVSSEFATSYRDMTLQTLAAREMPVTAKVIAAVPENKRDYRCDPHARTAWDLAWHLAHSDVWFLNSIADLKFVPPGDAETCPCKTVAELESWYTKNFKSAAARVEKMSGQQLLTPIDFYGAYNLPAFGYLEFALKHSIHHRAQLGTYLRPMGAKCPSIYGGSYDEPWQG